MDAFDSAECFGYGSLKQTLNLRLVCEKYSELLLRDVKARLQDEGEERWKICMKVLRQIA